MMLFYIIVVLQLLSLTGASESGIVAGKISKPHSRPYMASLQVNGAHHCGGMLIREDFVLTAAHCRRQNGKVIDITVVLGAHNIKKKEKSQKRIAVAEYLPHPKFNPKNTNLTYDIMLLKLKTKAKLNGFVQPIGLPMWNQKINTKCEVAGWGITGPSAPLSDVLRETTVQTLASAECKRRWKDFDFNVERQICTRTNRNKPGICQGDSGGPLICAGKLHGISSFTSSAGCDDPSYPNVFTNVPSFSQWIKTEMG